MIIRKLFKFEGAHIVRNCSSNRCSHSIHGHSYIVEVFLTASALDNGQMVYDFGLMKGTIKDLIDSFDHALSVWDKDKQMVDIARETSDRYIIMPVSPSAEQYSLMFLFLLDKILKNTQFNNKECGVHMSSVRVHETSTGYAESFIEDLKMVNYNLENIIFSDQIKKEWSNKEMLNDLIKQSSFINPIIIPQID